MPNKYEETPDTIKQLLTDLERLDETVARLNPELRSVLGNDYFSDIMHSLQSVAQEGKIQINDLNNFRCYFKQMLRSHPRATFLSTSSLATFHLWNERGMKEALKNFIREGGRIEQIFFVKNLEELASPELETILDSLHEAGITLRAVNIERVPDELRRHFFVESGKKIAWELSTSDNAGQGIITTDQQATANYCQMYDELRSLAYQLLFQP